MQIEIIEAESTRSKFENKKGIKNSKLSYLGVFKKAGVSYFFVI